MTAVLPFALTYGVFFVYALVRATTAYRSGRRMRGASQRAGPLRPPDERDRLLAESEVRRYGAFAVAFSFLTFRLQAAVNVTAGAKGMPMRWYVPGVVVGAAFWSAAYTTLGFVPLVAVFGPKLDPWIAGAVLVVLLLGVALVDRTAEAPQMPGDQPV